MFYEEAGNKLRPGDILYIRNWNAHNDSYWMILTSFCDLDYRVHTVLSRIKPIESIPNLMESKKGDIRRYRVLYYFYLPPLEGEFPESIAHYGMLSPISRWMLEQARETATDIKLIKSLAEGTRKLFQYHIANHFTRDETHELFKPHIEGFVKALKKVENNTIDRDRIT